LFDIVLYPFPTMQGCYLCPEDNLTPSQLQHYLLAYKENNTTKNRKGFLQLTLTCCQSWIDSPPPCLALGVFLDFPLLPFLWPII
jgi:hypothetical protein